MGVRTLTTFETMAAFFPKPRLFTAHYLILWGNNPVVVIFRLWLCSITIYEWSRSSLSLGAITTKFATQS